MSKKIAEGTAALVLDVKVGSGAFMKNIELAAELARTMVDLGNDSGVKTSALLTDMSTPLGLKIGNALEVEESIEVLAGGGPADVIELTVELAAEMLRLSGVDADPRENLNNGRAMDAWRAMITAQGGDLDAELPRAREQHQVLATETGYITKLDALALGVSSWRLGAGRERKEDAVQLGAGIELHAQLGDRVQAGDALMTLHTDQPERFDRALQSLEGAVAYGDQAVTRTLIHQRIQ
jgi:thymidine phosphorylase